MQVGVDIVQISNFVKRLDDPNTVAKIFTPSELEYAKNAQTLAGIFAAKEAFFKALGRKENWLLVEVSHNREGRPKIHSNTPYSHDSRIEISISHDGDYAIATVLLEIVPF